MDWILILKIFGALLGSGALVKALHMLWIISKRDSVLDKVVEEIDYAKDKLKRLEHHLSDKEETIVGKIGGANDRVTDIEKNIIEMQVNQKNMIHSINSQNKQILNLIERLEKNHGSFIDTQRSINDKLEQSIDAIKDSLINSTHSHCIFYKKGIKEIKDIIGVPPRT